MGVKTTGIDLLMDDLTKLANAVGGDLPDKMLDAGAEAAIEDWKEGIESAGHVDTGAMRDSVGIAPGTEKGLKREIYPQGTDRKGVRNAEKAYIQHYGRKSKKGDRFVDKINKKVKIDSYKAMSHVFDEEKNKIFK